MITLRWWFRWWRRGTRLPNNLSDDMKQGLHALVGWIGHDAVLEGLEKDKRDAEKEVKQFEDLIAFVNDNLKDAIAELRGA